MTILVDGKHTAEFIVSEASGYRSRQEVTVTVPSGGLEAGTIVGKITATGKYVRHAAGASNGSETEAGILFAGFTETGDTNATIIARDAEVVGSDLTYEDGADAAQITASNDALAAIGLIVR